MVTGEWYSNFYMRQELACKYNLWQVGSMFFSFKVYQKSRVGQAFIYRKNRHMVCSELNICHDIFLDKKWNDNDYSTPLRHAALDVDQMFLCWELVCITINFHFFVYNIRIIMNMILSVIFSSPRWNNLPSGHQRYLLKGLNLGYIYWGQKHSSG